MEAGERGAMKRLAVGAVALVLILAGRGTGVQDEKGWNKGSAEGRRRPPPSRL